MHFLLAMLIAGYLWKFLVILLINHRETGMGLTHLPDLYLCRKVIANAAAELPQKSCAFCILFSTGTIFVSQGTLSWCHTPITMKLIFLNRARRARQEYVKHLPVLFRLCEIIRFEFLEKSQYLCGKFVTRLSAKNRF